MPSTTDGSIVSDGGGRFTDSDLATIPVTPTAVDASGIERIVGPAVDNWRPAAVKPTDEAKERHERFLARSAQAKKDRLGALTDTERLDDTAQPLVDANKARDEDEAAALKDASDSQVGE